MESLDPSDENIQSAKIVAEELVAACHTELAKAKLDQIFTSLFETLNEEKPIVSDGALDAWYDLCLILNLEYED